MSFGICERTLNPAACGDGKIGEVRLYAQPMILPLDVNGTIYAIQDEKGNTIGTGTREVCEMLLYIITKPSSESISGRSKNANPHRPNVRAAIGI